MKQLKFTLTLVAIMLFACSVFSQAKWDFKTKKINDSISELQLKVKLGDGWHIYSQYTKGTELPIVFEFEKSNDYQRIGKVIEPKAIAE
ncbi:MAG: hypothetical protein PHV65_02025 [Bacteroidales bacterium]|nr:hypothetical protein [Bacteroidales bacterium]